MFVGAFATAAMVCIVENLFEDGEWAILEWRDPKGLRGCGFFHVQRDQIVSSAGIGTSLVPSPAGSAIVNGMRKGPLPSTI
jgi:hypothetical protein